MSMSSSRPFIIRALYEWILENDCTPYILVNAFADGVEVPQEHVKDGQIILNISPSAVQSLLVENQSLEFNGRFAGIPTRVYVPMQAVMGIYAKENGQGMVFDSESGNPEPPPAPDSGGSDKPKPSSSSKNKPGLRVVK
ncbi:MAG: ClpXP protease specificity-enhancing factor [Gammaproteobacteria bacterium]|jgi:stringent starvation protein B|nr:ClpXP protease specificity-enhancing factor [Gammaproteobacteria bacterium]MBQ15389.1 ClpXP protease specificity-enhancing factor [Gammaproteobacteria bacterium]MDP6096159.1 ClpXP protease specificity-enhancing factor [Gammaproteobacteria bacterium]HJO10421.1 ClpXP protease specificity-enhancing factor [Gammaproteobacteria bacterium]